MVLVVDEVVFATHQKCVGNGSKLEIIRNKLGTLGSLAKAVRLVLAGKGLDQFACKFRTR